MQKLGKEWVFFDGGTGTILQSMGLAPGELPESWNLSHPEKIKSLHASYLKAGCDIFNTNTFGANRLRFPHQWKEIVRSAVFLAKEARQEAGRQDAAIALDIGPCGKLLSPMGDLAFEDAVSLFGEVIQAGSEAGADLVLIETMNDSYETKAAVLAAKENCSLPVFVTMVFDSNGKMLTGGTPESMTAMLEGLGVDALGTNCSLGPAEMLPIAERLVKASSLPVIVNPNAGLPVVEGGKTCYNVGAEEFSDIMTDIARLGVHGLGGCCGTMPEYIARTREKVSPLPFQRPVPKNLTVVSSFSQAVSPDTCPLLIGERINPTGKKRFQQALTCHDMDYILKEGLAQEDAGAHILDVNLGLPGIDEALMLEEAIVKLQSITALPLQIDTSDVNALEKALRAYNGKALINSVNGKSEVMKEVFPLVKKYGGVVVGLPLDENGIPQTADDRIRVARKILETAAEYGISSKDIVIDGLAMTVSADPASALVTLETIRRLRQELGLHTILGVSNISFGLPARGILNATFLTMALYAGLSFAIMNPMSDPMMQAYRAFLALTAQDPSFSGFISACKDLPRPAAGSAGQGIQSAKNISDAVQADAAVGKTDEAGSGRSLYHEILRGMDSYAERSARELLKNKPALSVIDEDIVPALNLVGKNFEQGSMFLPQLLMSAEAAKKAFEVVKEMMGTNSEQSKGTIILATVKGDIHDIGKNIVKVMLENYGYRILDLGKDVPAETIVEAAIEHQIRLVGLSALMTTTVPGMEETIRLLREKKPDTRIMVGGAVLTQEYADRIGADAYGADAMASVRYADKVFGKE